MSQNRRTFMKEAAIAGAAAACTVPAVPRTVNADSDEYSAKARCPYFDQPLTCGGPNQNGVYQCDA